MAVAYRSSAGTNFLTANSITLSEPASSTTDDILIAVVYHEGGSGVTITPVGSWNLIHRTDQGGTGDITMASYWIRRGGSAPSYVFNLSSSVVVQGDVITYSGCVTSGDPQDAAATENSGSTGNLICTGLTTSTNNSMIIGIGSCYTFNAFSSTDFTNERIDGDANKGIAIYDDGLLTSAGATGNLGINSPNTSDPWIAHLIALKPPAAAPAVSAATAFMTTNTRYWGT
jgi:hypothetical protein